MPAITIPMSDGGEMGAYVSVPASGHGPGALVLMEIFGVGTYIRHATERLAELGYVAIAPDLYRRIEPGLELGHDPEGLRAAFEAVQKLDHVGAVSDAAEALAALRAMPEVGDRPTAVLGFCLGGRLAYELAVAGDPAAAVCYYGSGIAGALDRAAQIDCPVQFHFGAEDEYIPLSDAEAVCRTASAHDGWECHIQPDGGHAFDNHDAPRFSRPEAAARAWRLTGDFLQRQLG
jgi:carboxymethylenebutenolidase